MIINDTINALLKNADTKARTKGLVDRMADLFVFLSRDPAEETEATVESLLNEIKQDLEALNEQSVSSGIGELYIDEGHIGKDIKEYLIKELKRDVYGTKL